MQSNTSYLYEYEHHKRLRNAGFLKFHASSDLYLIRLHINLPFSDPGLPGTFMHFPLPPASVPYIR